jgi:two-component system response regulator (stage 0 sporulation protein A)
MTNKKIKVLIGDDTKEYGFALAIYLRQKNMYVATRSKDGGILLEAMKNGGFDVVICEATMPHLDAIELMKEGSKTLGTSCPKFIVTSSYDNPFLEQQIVQNGAANFMLKPFELSTLSDRIIALTQLDIINRNVLSKDNAGEDLEILVTEMIHQLGVPAHIKGYHYLRESILRSIDNPDLLESVTKKLYPCVAQKFQTTQSRVERAIRHAIEIAWDRGNIDVLQDFFGYTINTTKGKPTNSEFIALITDRIRLQQKPRSAA